MRSAVSGPSGAARSLPAMPAVALDLPGPSRRIRVEPLIAPVISPVPAPAPVPEPSPLPDPVPAPVPEREPVPAGRLAHAA